MEEKIDGIVILSDYTLYNNYGSLRGVLRSINTCAPWINNVFLVVQKESQVPKWVNRKSVRVVLHEEFIPKEYIPVYNRNIVELHLHFIPGLSEKFIYFNEGCFLLKKINPDYFFIKEKCVHEVVISENSDIKQYDEKIGSDIGKNALGVKDDFCYRSPYAIIPMFKSLNEELYNKVYAKSMIDANAKLPFISYAYLKRRIINVPTRNSHISFKNKTITNIRKWMVKICYSEEMSINVQDVSSNFDKNIFYEMVKESIYYLFPNKSKKYEV